MPKMPRLLIIDDEEDLGEILADYLEDEFTSTVCSDPEKALTLIQDRSFDLIISDMHMPKLSGFDIIAAAAKIQPQTPVILLTGNSRSDPVIQEAIDLGAKGIITKPFHSPDQVVSYLKKFIPT